MRVRKTTGKGSAAWLLLAVATVSCTAWVQRAEEPEAVAARYPALVVIGMSGGSELVLRRPTIARDSLVGRRIESLTDRGEGERAAVPIVRMEERPRVRVVVEDQATTVHFPRILGDSLVGSRVEGTSTRKTADRVAFSLEEIESIETEAFDGSKTALALAGGIGFWWALVLAFLPET